MSEERIDKLSPNPFLNGPGDLLAFYCAENIALVPQFKKIFGQYIDGYMRQDFSMRSLPAMRIYNPNYTLEQDNWFEVGNLTCDVLFPMNVRRQALQNLPDIVTSALVQQFRRTPFFTTLRGFVPGLNWLGQSITVQKDLAYKIDENTLVPMTEMTINFRVDLREWDLYLESQDRTVDNPFEKTLATLNKIYTTIHPENQDGSSANVDLTIQQPASGF